MYVTLAVVSAQRLARGDAADARTAVAEAPEGITVLHHIPAIGTKFHRPADLGPAAGGRPGPGLRRGGVWLSFSAERPVRR